MTYSTLISKKSGSSRSSGNSRYYQLLRWCGERSFDGVIILDECHNAKTGTVAKAKGQKASLSKTAQTVSMLQEALPNARVVYSSATGGSDEKEMGYMQRLGLWGSGTSYSSFSDLAIKLSKGGLSFLEMLCCDIKAKGAFVSRQLSFQGCSFSIQEASMSSEMESMYSQSVQIWRQLFTGFKEALNVSFAYSLRRRLRCRIPSSRRHDEWTMTWTMPWTRAK